MQVGRILLVHDDHVGSGFHEGVDVPVRFLDHQVGFQGQFRQRVDGLDDEGAHGDVRDEPSVHDVDMDPVRARALHGTDLIGQAGEIRRQDGWSDLDHGPPPLFFCST